MLFRSDGSSVFGSDVRWGTFPAVGLGWTFSDEPFMKNLWWLSFGKFRASWGRSGQKFNEAYLALGTMSTSNTFLGNSGLIPGLLANNQLTWEKNDQYDLGLDLQLFNYRLQVKLDYYYKYSHALLMQTSTPGNFFLADKMWNNSSAISNEGIETSVVVVDSCRERELQTLDDVIVESAAQSNIVVGVHSIDSSQGLHSGLFGDASFSWQEGGL